MDVPAENETWPSLTIKRIIGESDDYIQALEKLAEAEESSLLEDSTSNATSTLTKHRKKRQGKKKKVLTSNEEKSESENISKNKHPQFDVIASPDHSNDDDEEVPPPKRNTICSQSTIFGAPASVSNLQRRTPVIASISEYSTSRMQRLSEQTHDQSFKETVLRQLTKTVAYLESIDRRLLNLEKQEIQSDEDSIEEEDIFPLEYTDQLENLENRLKSKGFFKKIVNMVQKTGGKDVSTATAAMLKLMLSNQIAERYSWDGRKGKPPFKELLIAKILKRAVHSLKFPDCSDFEIKKAASLWLAQAKIRRIRHENKNLQRNK